MIDQLIQVHVQSTAVGRQSFPTLEGSAIAKIAQATGLSRREAAIAALERGVVPLRFLAHRGSVPQADLARLLRSCVAVCGLGGLGGHVVTLLARLGVGQLVLIDGDRFAETNLNRQVFCTMAALGRLKVDVTREGLAAITDLTEVVGHPTWIDDDNAPQLLEGCDVVVDGFDNIKGREVMRRACAKLGIPFVGSGVDGFAGWVGSFPPGTPDFFPMIAAPNFLPPNPAPEGKVNADVGVFPATPHMMAGFEVAEVFRILCQRGPAPGDILTLNSFSWTFVPKKLG